MKKRLLKKLSSFNYEYPSIKAHECFMSKKSIRLCLEQNKPVPSFVKKFHGKQAFSEDERTKLKKKFCIRLITRAKILSRHFKSTVDDRGTLAVGPISIPSILKQSNNFKIHVNKLIFDQAKEYNLI